jgi:peptidoglycan/LPS O-acetylase OafA/YrhL
VLLARYGECLLARLPSGRLAKSWLLLLGLSLYQSHGWLVTRYPGVHTAGKCGWIATSIGCGLVLLAVFSSRSLQAVLNARPLVFLGRISYSVYLVQFIVILCCLPLVVRLGNAAGWPIPVLFAAAVVAGVAGTVGLSAVTYRIMEVPAINLGHDLTRRLQARLKKETPAPAKD